MATLPSAVYESLKRLRAEPREKLKVQDVRRVLRNVLMPKYKAMQHHKRTPIRKVAVKIRLLYLNGEFAAAIVQSVRPDVHPEDQCLAKIGSMARSQIECILPLLRANDESLCNRISGLCGAEPASASMQTQGPMKEIWARAHFPGRPRRMTVPLIPASEG